MRPVLLFYGAIAKRFIIGAIVCLLALLPLQGLVAAEDSAVGWLTTGDPEIKFAGLPADYTPPYSYNYNTDCDTQDFNVVIRQAKQIDVAPYSQTELRYRAACAVSTYRGLTDGVYLDAGIPAGKFAGHSGSMAMIPNSKVLMSLRTVTSGVSLEASFYDTIAPQYNPTTGEVQYDLAGHRLLKDQAGATIYLRPGSIGYSSDGQWMVADSSVGFIRVDLANEKIVPFANGLTYGGGLDPAPRVAISPDGRYAAVASGQAMFKIYDLKTCADVPFSITGPVSCQFKDVQPFLSSKFNAYILSYYTRFASPEFLTFVTAYRDQSGTVHKASVRMAPSGQAIEDISYLALGDSFSSGEGELEDAYYEVGTNEPENNCHLSKRSYPYLIAQTSTITEFHSVACSGAKIVDYTKSQGDRESKKGLSLSNELGDWLPGPKSQHEFVRMADGSQVLTISMSGNDIGFSNKLEECLGIGTCRYAGDPDDRAGVAKEIAGLYKPLKQLYGQIITDTNSRTKIYVIGYPQIVSANLQCDSNVHLDDEEAIFARQATSYINDVIRAAADAAGVYYMDIEDALEGSNLCSGNAQSVNGVTDGDDIILPWWKRLPAKVATGHISFGNESFHPNAKGHELMAAAMHGATEGSMITFNLCPGSPAGTIVCPKSNIQIPSPDQIYFGTSAVSYVYCLNNTSACQLPSSEDVLLQLRQIIAEPTEPTDNREINVRIETGLKPGTTITLELRSDPTTLGTFTVDQYGTIDATVVVPDAVAAGYHTLHLLGQNIAGQNVDYYQPVLVTGEEGDLDEDGTPDEQDPCGFVETSGVDQDKDGVDDACDPEIGEPPADSTPPEVAGVPDRGANENGWYNADVTIGWTATDPNPSSGIPTQPAATLANQEGLRTYTSDLSCDPLGNCATGSLELKIDKTAPVLGAAMWTNNPKSVMGSATITLPATDSISGVAVAEYYLGDIDPGQGNGATMQVDDGAISVSFGADFPTGVYKVNMRVKDRAGNWSAPSTDYLVVYDPFGTRMTGKRTLLPSLINGDALPGLVVAEQDDKAKFGFNVRYDQNGQIHKHSDFQFKYETGTKCNRPTLAQNCHTFELNATSITWLTTQGQHDSTGIFQGTAKLEIDGVASDVTFRLTGLDGERLNTVSEDYLTLKVYASGATPDDGNSIYQVDARVLRGNIKIRKW